MQTPVSVSERVLLFCVGSIVVPPFYGHRAGRGADLRERALLHGAGHRLRGRVELARESLDHDAARSFEHDRTAEPATIRQSRRSRMCPVQVGTPADARAAPVSQCSGPRIDLAQSGCDKAGVERDGFAVDGAQSELIGRILRREFHFARAAMGELGWLGQNPVSAAVSWHSAKACSLSTTPARVPLGDLLAGAQADAEGAID